jgi:hypothetical protein
LEAKCIFALRRLWLFSLASQRVPGEHAAGVAWSSWMLRGDLRPAVGLCGLFGEARRRGLSEVPRISI